MIKRYDPGIARDWETSDDEAVLEESPKGMCVLAEDTKSRLEALLWLLNTANLADAGKAHLEQLIEELK